MKNLNLSDNKKIPDQTVGDFYLTEKSNVEFTYNCLKEDDIKTLEMKVLDSLTKLSIVVRS